MLKLNLKGGSFTWKLCSSKEKNCRFFYRKHGMPNAIFHRELFDFETLKFHMTIGKFTNDKYAIALHSLKENITFFDNGEIIQK